MGSIPGRVTPKIWVVPTCKASFLACWLDRMLSRPGKKCHVFMLFFSKVDFFSFLNLACALFLQLCDQLSLFFSNFSEILSNPTMFVAQQKVGAVAQFLQSRETQKQLGYVQQSDEVWRFLPAFLLLVASSAFSLHKLEHNIASKRSSMMSIYLDSGSRESLIIPHSLDKVWILG